MTALSTLSKLQERRRGAKEEEEEVEKKIKNKNKYTSTANSINSFAQSSAFHHRPAKWLQKAGNLISSAADSVIDIVASHHVMKTSVHTVLRVRGAGSLKLLLADNLTNQVSATPARDLSNRHRGQDSSGVEHGTKTTRATAAEPWHDFLERVWRT